MKIAILGTGGAPIPPPGRGAIESVIWAYAEGLRQRSHEVEILNVRPGKIPLALPHLLRTGGFDWIWTHHERMVPWANFWGRCFGASVVHTSHRPVTDLEGLDRNTARRIRLGARAGHHFGLTHEILLTDRVLNPTCRVAHAPNGVGLAEFRRTISGNGRAICVGGVSRRKRQRQVAEALVGTGIVCDFVGPLDHRDEETATVASLPTYLGEWSHETLGERLTDYSALVLYSRAEAQPLVVGEAFAAGLSVVLSPEAARNVDASRPFVTIVRTPEEIAPALARAIEENGRLRPEIVAHAREEWDWNAKIDAVERRLSAWRAR